MRAMSAGARWGRLLAFGLAALVCGCDGDGGATRDRPRERPIELFSWWTRAGEGDALGALVREHRKAHPNDDVINASAELSGLARRTLGERMQRGDPPDVFEANAGQDLMHWVLQNGIDDRESKLLPLDALAGATELRAALPAPLLAQVTYGGKLYGVPANLHRINEIFYSRALFERFGLGVPKTLPELLALRDEAHARGIPLLAVGSKEPWTLVLLAFECVAVALHGRAFYQEYFSGHLKPDDPRMLEALEATLALLAAANADHAQLSWLQALELVVRGGAFMTVMGDWARVPLAARGLEPGRDYGEQPFPGAEQTFVFTSDAFALPRRAKNPDGARRLLATMASRAGQAAIAEARSALTARTDVALAAPDEVLLARRQLAGQDALVLAQSGLVPARFNEDVSAALAEAAARRDIEPVLHALKSRYALLR
jgi:glucose/mannose transport system substrate-binding protein